MYVYFPYTALTSASTSDGLSVFISENNATFSFEDATELLAYLNANLFTLDVDVDEEQLYARIEDG